MSSVETEVCRPLQQARHGCVCGPSGMAQGRCTATEPGLHALQLLKALSASQHVQGAVHRAPDSTRLLSLASSLLAATPADAR